MTARVDRFAVRSFALVTVVWALLGAGSALASTRVVWARGQHVAGAAVRERPPFTIRNDHTVALACATVRLCVSVETAGQVLASTHPARGAAAWTAYSLGDGPLSSVACPSDRLCIATDENGNVLWSKAPAAGRASWHGAHLEGPYTASYLFDLHCPTVRVCVALDSVSGSVWTSRAPAAGSAAWHQTEIDAPSAEACGHDAVSAICQPGLWGLGLRRDPLRRR